MQVSPGGVGESIEAVRVLDGGWDSADSIVCTTGRADQREGVVLNLSLSGRWPIFVWLPIGDSSLTHRQRSLPHTRWMRVSPNRLTNGSLVR
jgi:hypothetical protein